MAAQSPQSRINVMISWCVKSMIAFWFLNAIPGILITYFSITILFTAITDFFSIGIVSSSIIFPAVLWLVFAVFAVFTLLRWMHSLKNGVLLIDCLLSVILWIIPLTVCAVYAVHLTRVAGDSTPDTDHGGDSIDLWNFVPFPLMGLIWFLAPLAIGILLTVTSQRMQSEQRDPSSE